MVSWLANQNEADKPIVFDGTIAGIIKHYQTHPESPYHELDDGSQRSYDHDLRVICRTVGERRVDRLNGIDFRRWYKQFKRPEREGGPERISRAHHLITTVRIIFSFGVELGLPHAKRVRDALSEIDFPDAPPRNQRVTYEQAVAVITKAHELGYPEIALAQALQFEGTLRQTDVIGKWQKKKSDPNVREWGTGIVWSEISADRILKHRTGKRGREVLLDLKLYPLVVAELDRLAAVPRVGPVIIDSKTGEPFKYRVYARRWREIARAAGIPDDVWNRDSRAGGVTEGGDAGADIEDLRQHAGHANIRMTQRYDRQTLVKTSRVAQARVKYRNKP
jgi:integrase